MRTKTTPIRGAERAGFGLSLQGPSGSASLIAAAAPPIRLFMLAALR